MIPKTMSSMFQKVGSGMCRLSMNGIAIKTSSGYKTYDPNTGTLVNCEDFVFDVGDDIFIAMLTNSVNRGEIIMSNGYPVCVIDMMPGQIRAFRYEDSSIVTIVPENHVFFGNTYFYYKIISLFGDMNGGFDMQRLMSAMFMNEMMKGNSNSNNENTSSFSKILPYAMMFGNGSFNFNNMFGNMFGGPTTNPATSNTPVMPNINTPMPNTVPSFNANPTMGFVGTPTYNLTNTAINNGESSSVINTNTFSNKTESESANG